MGDLAEAGGGSDLKKILVVVGQIVATIVVTWFIVDQAGLTASRLRGLDLGSWAVDWWLFVGSCVILVSGYFGSGFLWGRIVYGLGGPKLPAPVAIRLFMVANLGRYLPGKVWQIAGLVALARRRDIPATTATAGAVLSQGIGLASATLVGLASLWTLGEGEVWRWVVPAVLFGVVGVGLMPPVFNAAVSAWFRVARTAPPDDLRPIRAFEWLCLGLATWVVYSVAFWVLVESLGLDVALLPTASSFAAAYVLGYIIVFAPAGLGVREGFLIALMAPQIGPGPAGAVAVLARLWSTTIEVIPAAAFWGRHVAITHRTPPSHE